jgi:hypothetical protein
MKGYVMCYVWPELKAQIERQRKERPGLAGKEMLKGISFFVP